MASCLPHLPQNPTLGIRAHAERSPTRWLRELLVKLGDTAGAFHVIEGVRGRTLAAALQDGKTASSSTPAQTTLLDADVAAIQTRLMQSADPAERQQLLDTLAEYEWRSRLAWNKGEHRFPTKSAPLYQVQDRLKPDELLLEYVLDEPNSICIVVSPHSAELHVLPVGRKQLERLVQHYVNEIHAKSAASAEAKELYRILMLPIPETSTDKRLVVIPDGILNLLPFDALRDGDGVYLLQSRIVSYAPSATIITVLRQGRPSQQAARPFLGVGGVDYEGRGAALKNISATDMLRGSLVRELADLAGLRLYNLPQTRQEVESIARIVGKNAETLLGESATETIFKREPLSDFRVLHLAVHGFGDPQYPERSALVLGADPGAGEDGLLQVREIKRLRLKAELTTLSACDSGVGTLQGEEGVSDLAEAFLAAGSKAVVASLWSADDTSAS